jgi:hypothetical protein
MAAHESKAVTLPKPDRVDADLREIERVLPSIRELYREAYQHGLRKTGVGLDGEGGRPGFSDSDPTGEIVADRLRARWRKLTEKAAGKVMAAMEELYAARNDLERVVGPIQNQMADRPARNAVISAEEFQASLDARRRRVNRGGGFGEG